MGKLTPLVPLLSLIGLVFCGSAAAQTGEPTIELITEPAASQLRPLGAADTEQKVPATLKLQARDATGQPLKKARIRLQIQTPDSTPWFSTDFPWTEGQQLLDLTTVAAQGSLQVQQILPIRGSYQLTATVAPVIGNGFQPFQQQWTLPVAERWDKYRNFGLLAMVLVAAGFGGGWILGGRQQRLAGEVAPQRVRLLLSGATLVAIAVLLGVNISAELTPTPHRHSAAAGGDAEQPAQGLLVQLGGDTEAVVGQTANLEVQILDAQTQRPVTDVLLTLQVTQLEDGWLTFAYQGTPDQQGRLAWQQQFVDGTPHQLTVQVAPLPGADSVKTFEVSRRLEVAGIAPPMTRRLISLAYMSGILTVSLLLGLGLRRQLAAFQTHSS